MVAVAFSDCENTYESQHTAGIDLRDMLLHGFDIKPEDFLFSKTKEGKPYADGAPFLFSISHSRSLCCCAVSADTSFKADAAFHFPADLHVYADAQTVHFLVPLFYSNHLWFRKYLNRDIFFP